LPNISGDIADFEFGFEVVVVGAGACGFSAGLAAADVGAQTLAIERDAKPLGSTAMSTGLIRAAGTPEQAALGIDDDWATLTADILKTSKNRRKPWRGCGIGTVCP